MLFRQNSKFKFGDPGPPRMKVEGPRPMRSPGYATYGFVTMPNNIQVKYFRLDDG